MNLHILTPSLRRRLKIPLGLLIRGSPEYTTERLKELIECMEPSKIITVGDSVSENMIERGVSPDILIVDNKIMRKPIAPIKVDVDQTLHLRNPPGTITDEAWHVMKEALKQKRAKIMVEGEEDLLTLVATLCAPENSMIIYGQPNEGVVVVEVNEEMKEKVSKILNEMERQN